jgi:alpha-maltose-1-phosphate synthase
MKKAIVVSSYNVLAPSAWSGVPYYFTKTLRGMVEDVLVLSSLSPHSPRFTREKVLHYKEAEQWYMPSRDIDLIRYRAQYANSVLLDHDDADIVFVFHPPDAAFLNTKIPIAILHDGTWQQWASTYPRLLGRRLADETAVGGTTLERLAFDKATWIFLFTNWAADAVRNSYPKLQAQVRTILPGANLSDDPGVSAVKRMIDRRDRSHPTIMFVGKDGYRKGVDVAVNTQRALRRAELRTKLLLIGVSKSPNGDRMFGAEDVRTLESEDIIVYPYLNKGKEYPQASLLQTLYSESFVLLVPSRAEFSSMAICDAAAFGLPAIASDVGGNAELVIDGKTGIVLARDSTPEVYARAIHDMVNDPILHVHMCERARLRYETTLNWKVHLDNIFKTISIR